MGNKVSRDDTKDGMKAFDTWLNQRLQKYFEDIETIVLNVKITDEATKDIREAVDEIVQNIFKEVEKIDARFRVKKSGLLKVGDFYEGSQVICLDEVELFVVLEELSGEERIEVENTTSEYFETLQVGVSEKCASTWEDCIVDSDKKKGLVSGEKLASRLYNAIEGSVAQLRTRSKDIVYKKHGYLELLDDTGITKRGCSTCLKFDWARGFFFSVILTPVLRLNRTDSYILYDEGLSEMVFEAINTCGSLLLVPEVQTDTEQHYFRLSLAHIECYLMSKQVTVPHRRVYRVLQFLLNGYKKKASCKYQLVTSEQIKTLVIMHDMACGKKNAIGKCVMKIVNKMAELLDDAASDDGQPFLPSVFVEHMNTFRKTTASVGKDVIRLNSSAVSKLKDHLVNDVGRSPSYIFGDVIEKLVPVNQFILDADYHARKSRVDLLDDGEDSPGLEFSK